jgi:ubiquinone/menaquinone biosynthesis C-methylase UbiE
MMSMINMLEIELSDKIIETGCGGCHLIPHIINRKKNSAEYFALDLSTNMLSVA